MAKGNQTTMTITDEFAAKVKSDQSDNNDDYR